MMPRIGNKSLRLNALTFIYGISVYRFFKHYRHSCSHKSYGSGLFQYSTSDNKKNIFYSTYQYPYGNTQKNNTNNNSGECFVFAMPVTMRLIDRL